MHETVQSLIIYSARVTLAVVAFLALIQFWLAVQKSLLAMKEHSVAKKLAEQQSRVSVIAPHLGGELSEWPDMPKVVLAMDLVPKFEPHFHPIPLQQWVSQHLWQLQITPQQHLIYAHSDGVLLYLSNIHHHGALPLSPDYPKALEQVFGLRLTLSLPCASHGTVATHALLTTADLIAEQLNAKPCLPNTRQRLSPQERELYHQAAAQHQSDYTKWQFSQLNRA